MAVVTAKVFDSQMVKEAEALKGQPQAYWGTVLWGPSLEVLFPILKNSIKTSRWTNSRLWEVAHLEEEDQAPDLTEHLVAILLLDKGAEAPDRSYHPFTCKIMKTNKAKKEDQIKN